MCTGDFDSIVVKENKNRIKAFLESLGYETIYESATFSNHVYSKPTPGWVDFVCISGDTSKTVLNSVRKMNGLADIEFEVACPEHMVALKVYTIKNEPGRPQPDTAEIKGLIDLELVNGKTVKEYFKKWNLSQAFHGMGKTRMLLDLDKDYLLPEMTLNFCGSQTRRRSHDGRIYRLPGAIPGGG